MITEKLDGVRYFIKDGICKPEDNNDQTRLDNKLMVNFRFMNMRE